MDMKPPKPTYQVLKNHKKDPTAILVRKGNITADFTIADLLTEQATFRRYIREGQGQLTYEQGVMANVLEHHPALAKLSPEDLFAAAMYEVARKKADTLIEQVGNIQRELDESLSTFADIQATLNITVPTKEDAVDAAMAKLEAGAKHDDA